VIGHGSEGATALFDMAGFVARAHLLEDGEWWLQVETPADRVGCGSCDGTPRCRADHGRRIPGAHATPLAGSSKTVWWTCWDAIPTPTSCAVWSAFSLVRAETDRPIDPSHRSANNGPE